MTLVLGAPCTDGVVIISDRKMTSYGTLGIQHPFGDKITGELDGVLTGFAGDAGAFQVFASTLKDYVMTTRREQIHESFRLSFIPGRRFGEFGPSVDQMKLKVSQIQNEFFTRNEKYRCRILMAISSIYSTNGLSMLFLFEPDGRCLSIIEPKAIGSGSPHVYYFLQRYWNRDKTTMKEFAQLGDFLIRYVGHDGITLDNAVGLSCDYPYPQIVFIPNDRDFCCPYNNGNPKSDCKPTQKELEQFKNYSQKKLKELHSQSFF